MPATTTARVAPEALAPAPAWPARAVLLDADGAALSAVGLLGPPRGDRLDLTDVEAPDAVLDYYFGHGGRQVMLQLVQRVVEGTLGTRWSGLDRDWWVELGDD